VGPVARRRRPPNRSTSCCRTRRRKRGSTTRWWMPLDSNNQRRWPDKRARRPHPRRREAYRSGLQRPYAGVDARAIEE